MSSWIVTPTEKVAACESVVIPFRKILSRPPMKAEPPVKVRL
jgi:hypothetical protein